ncbi:MAG: cytochrome b N-terminal domain-containing protein [Desulfohalobiaceae bacterium]|nr:cytochrome b N-terminal domain-containing protein [Desulfohalobiaceae bacterium]
MSWAEFSEKLGFKNFDYPVPEHANRLSRLIGGLALASFFITFITGILLTQFYNPSPDTAHTSVRYIMHVPWLSYIRSLHNVSANIGLALVILHMIRVLLSHAYIQPRIGTYLLGLLLLGTAFMEYFTGTILKWDQEGYEAMAHFIAVNDLLGPIGTVFLEDFTLSTSMLARMNALHISVLPQ